MYLKDLLRGLFVFVFCVYFKEIIHIIMLLLIVILFLSNFDSIVMDENDPYEIVPFPTCWSDVVKAMKKVTNKTYERYRYDEKWPECGGMPLKKRQSKKYSKYKFKSLLEYLFLYY